MVWPRCRQIALASGVCLLGWCAPIKSSCSFYSGPLELDHREGGYLLRASQPQCPLRPGAVDLTGRTVVERLMRALLAVEPEVGRQARHQFGDEFIRFNVDILVFYTPPEPLDEHIVQRPPPP